MTKKILEKLSDFVSEAHANIQRDFVELNPVVGLSSGMRSVGIPADVMTIDCLKTDKRIIIVLHDEKPEVIQYQFTYKTQDPGVDFELMPAAEISTQVFYDWMKKYLG